MCADVQASQPTGKQVEEAVQTLAMLAEPTRVRLLWAMLDGERAVHDLAVVVGCSPTSVSQHLAKLHLAGLVRRRRRGRNVLYTADDVHVRRLLQEALHHADHAVQNHPDHG
jgi:DNA-binding transcriptional ArsR family regulator